MAYGPLTDAELAAQKSLTDEIGEKTEKRFFQIMMSPVAFTHAWYEGIRKASRHEDKNGVDFFALIKTKEGCIDEIPIQIKSSRKWLPEFFRQHPKFRGEIIIVAWYMTDDEIRKFTFNMLKKYARKRR